MDAAQFCSQTRLVIVAGKGGVGKTTVSLALAAMAARAGRSALIVEVEGKGGLSAAVGAGELRYEENVVIAAGGPTGGPAGDPTGGPTGDPIGGQAGTADVRARTLTPDDALLEYLADHGLRRISKRLVQSGALDVAATAAPGIKDILVLGKVKQLERMKAADLIVLDAPAAGHAVSFLMSAAAILDAVRVGPLRSQAEDVLELLTDPARCQVVLVTLPEETPVNEVVETAFSLEDRVGVKLGPVVVNGLYPVIEGLLEADPEEAAAVAATTLRVGEAESLREAARFRASRQALQQEQIGRLADSLPLPQLALPFVFSTDLGLPDIERLAAALATAVGGLEPRAA